MGKVKEWLIAMQMEAQYQIEEAQGNLGQAEENFLKKYPGQERVFKEMLEAMRQFYGCP